MKTIYTTKVQRNKSELTLEKLNKRHKKLKFLSAHKDFSQSDYSPL